MPRQEDVFVQLAARLDNPEEVPSLPEILKIMVTARQAAILLTLPGTLEEIRERTGADPAEVEATLDKCYRSGLVLRVAREGQQPEYAFPDLYIDNIVGDPRVNSLGTRYRRLWQQWTEEHKARRSLEIEPGATPSCRILPAVSALSDLEAIPPEENVQAIVEASRARVVQQCSCRFRNRDCEYPRENICIGLDLWAEEAVARGYGKLATKEEVFAVLHRASEAGLVHVTSSAYFAEAPLGTEFICNCCPCCCELLEPYLASGRKIPIVVNYHAAVDAEKCTGCLLCEDRCHFDALSFRQDIAEVQQAKCVGCGLCAVVCEEGAIAVVRAPDARCERPRHAQRHMINPRHLARPRK